MNYILEYYQKIISEEIKASKKIIKQYEKLFNDIQCVSDSQWAFDEAKGTRPIEFVEKFCYHSKGVWKGQLIKLELWQKAALQALFGFVNKYTGYRRYREFHLYVGRKNGKSLLASCIGIYMLIADHEGGPEIYSAATKQDQAKISYKMALGTIRQSPLLRKRLRINVQGIFVQGEEDSSYFQPLSSESKKLDGSNPHCVIVDELHAIVDRNLLDVLRDGQRSRKQPILIIITTMGDVRGSVFDETYEEDERKLFDDTADEQTLILCYELDTDEEWTDIKNAVKANPNINVSFDMDNLKRDIALAKENPRKVPNLLAKYFNRRVTPERTWLPFDDVNNEKTFTAPKKKYAIGSFDLSRTGDLTAFNTLYYDKEHNEYQSETMYWIPEAKLEDGSKLAQVYKQWVERKLMRTCPGNKIDYHMIVDYVFKEMAIERQIIYLWIYYDSYSATYLVDELAGAGFAKDRCLIPAIQGFKTLSVPMQEMESELKNKRINYNNNPITKWCLTNVELVKDRNGNFMPKKYDDKQNRKIDGMVVILICFVGLVAHKKEFIELY